MEKSKRILVYGYGNPGRQDDAMGVLMAEEIQKWSKENNYSFIDIDQNYQLNIEDADRISKYDIVIFADASIADIDGCLLEEIEPDTRTDFSMHSVTPAFVVGLCNQVFTEHPACYQLHIKGYSFNFMEDPTGNALDNFNKALALLKLFIQEKAEVCCID